MLSLSRVKQATNEFIKILRLGKNDVQTVFPSLPHGLESKPIKEAIAVYASTMNSGDAVTVGYIQLNLERTQEGETLLYSTDSSGNRVFEILLNNAGECELGGNSDFLARFNELKNGFDQLTSDFNAFVSVFNSHVHISAAPGSPNAPTATPASATTASIDSAKINNIKTS